MNLSSGNGGTFLNRLITSGDAGAEAWLAERHAADPTFWTFSDAEEMLKGLVAGGHTRLVQIAFRAGWMPNAQQWPWVDKVATGPMRQAFVDAFAGKVTIADLSSSRSTTLVKELMTAASLRNEPSLPTVILPLRDQLSHLPSWGEAVGRCVAAAMNETDFADSSGGAIEKYAPDRFRWIAEQDGRHPLLRFAFTAGLDESAVRDLAKVMLAAPEPSAALAKGPVGKRSLSTPAIIEQLIRYPTIFAEAWVEHKGLINQLCFNNGSDLGVLERFLMVAQPSPLKQTLLAEFLESQTGDAMSVAKHALQAGDTDTVRAIQEKGAAKLPPADWLRAAWENPKVLVPLQDLIHAAPQDELKILRTLLTLGHVDPFKAVFVALNGPKHLQKLTAWLPPEISEASLSAIKPSYKSVDVAPLLKRISQQSAPSCAYSPEL